MSSQPATMTLPDAEGGPVTHARPDIAQVFGRAARHSRRVRLLRIAIPASLAVVVGVFLLWSLLDPWRLLKRLPVDIAGITISGSKVTMVAPKLSGYTRDARRYDFTAESAAQDLTKPDMIELKGVRAEIEMEDKSKLNVSATEGLFDRKGGLLTLSNNVVLTTTSGFQMNLQEAVVDITTGDVVSEKPVEVKTEEGNLKAGRFEVTHAGDEVRFDGGISMLVQPEVARGGNEGAPKP